MDNVNDNPEQPTLDGVPQGNWLDEWDGMPEFHQPQLKPWTEVIVRFETEGDFNDFVFLIDQNMTQLTKSIWHPELQRGKNSHLKYVDESEDTNGN